MKKKGLLRGPGGVEAPQELAGISNDIISRDYNERQPLFKQLTAVYW